MIKVEKRIVEIAVVYTNTLTTPTPAIYKELTFPKNKVAHIIKNYNEKNIKEFINILYTPEKNFKYGFLMRVVEIDTFYNLVKIKCESVSRVYIPLIDNGYYKNTKSFKKIIVVNDISKINLINELKILQFKIKELKIDEKSLTDKYVSDYLEVLVNFFANKYSLENKRLQKDFVEVNSQKQLLFNLKKMIQENSKVDQTILEIPIDEVRQRNEENRLIFLKKQKLQIDKELEKYNDESNLYTKLQNSDIPLNYHTEIKKEIARLETIDPSNSEYFGLKKYLDTIFELPYTQSKKIDISLENTKSILDDNHNGMNQVKERIIEEFAVMKNKENQQGSTLLFVGPPGTGKTSLAQSIAKSLNREYTRISLGGIRDESLIRGHRRTYIGAMPGRIITSLKSLKYNNPIFVLDEIDKLHSNNQGDPSSALLEVLDPEQNNNFVDNYLNMPFDLSNILFIATANSTANIPRPLLDRMEVIEISSYHEKEKIMIAKNHLLQKSLLKNGLKEKFVISEKTYLKIIQEYTKESGVRQLEKQINKIVRVALKESFEQKTSLGVIEITEKNLSQYLGKSKYIRKINSMKTIVGQVTGLAWTPVGGDVLTIQAILIPGKGKINLTGQLGSVMKESASLAFSRVKSEVLSFDYDKYDIHLHAPAGAIPKDGPSAGITMYTVLKSLILNKSIPTDIAMTGEMTLTGEVLAIGGLKEKITAAYNNSIKTIYLPMDNEKDLDDVDQEILSKIKIKLIRHCSEVQDLFK